MAAAFLTLGVAFFLGAGLSALAVLAAGFLVAVLTFFFGLLVFGLLAAADLLAFVLTVFLGEVLVVFFTPERQMSDVNERADG